MSSEAELGTDPRIEKILDLTTQLLADHSESRDVSRGTGDDLARVIAGLNMLVEKPPVTESKAAAEALRESVERYSTLVETIRHGVEDIDVYGTILFANSAHHRLHEYLDGELIGKSILDLVATDAERKALRDYLEFLVNEQPPPTVYTGQQRTKTGKVIDVEVAWNYRRDVKGRVVGFTSVISDITDRVQVERELIRLERLHAAGEMAAGVSHNLNNVLATILGPAQILRRSTAEPQALREIEAIIRSARRARDLVQSLHDAVQESGEVTLQPVRVNQVVQGAVQVAQPRWKDEPESRGLPIAVVTQLEEVPPIKGTVSGLHDILVNLLFNAVDASPEGGTITIATQAVEEGVQLLVSDTGTGMDEETRRRVFEPFFTTKMDVGTGLGLSTIYGTVSRWEGRIEVESTLGEGTTFTLRLPIWTELEVQEEERVATVRSVRRGRILVVEDDEEVAGMLSRILGKDHEIEVSSSGLEALERCEPGRYDVALLDLVMPEMPGDQVARQLRQVDPAIVAVLITGWNLRPDDPRLAAFDFQLLKPIDDLDEIDDVVNRATELHDARTEQRSCNVPQKLDRRLSSTLCNRVQRGETPWRRNAPRTVRSSKPRSRWRRPEIARQSVS